MLKSGASYIKKQKKLVLNREINGNVFCVTFCRCILCFASISGLKTVIIPQYICRILFSAPFASAVFFLLFYVPGSYRPEEAGKKPETEISMEGKLGYYLAMFCLFEGLMSVSSKVVKLAFFAFIRFEGLMSE